MKTNRTLPKSKTHGLTLVETLVVLVVVIVLAVFLWPYKTEKKAAAINCLGNLKQVGLGLTMYADENNGRFPLQGSVTNGGTMDIHDNHVFPYYKKAADNLGKAPIILICPFDTSRHAAADFETLTDSNISYFFNADAMRNSPTNSILSGDRFLENNGQPVKPGLFVLTTNLHVSWTPSIHKGGGNLLWSDGSVQQTTSYGWPSIIQSQPLVTNRLLIP
jgi:prepilin-type processing-associated H-X9-DG protein